MPAHISPVDPHAELNESFRDAHDINAAIIESLSSMAVGETVPLVLIEPQIGKAEVIEGLNQELTRGIAESIRLGRRAQDKLDTNAHSELREDGSVVSTSFGIVFNGGDLTQPTPVQYRVVKTPPTKGETPVITAMTITRVEPQAPRVVYGVHPNSLEISG